MTKLVYLSGPIEGLKYEDTVDWRQQVQFTLHKGIHGISPMRGKKVPALGEVILGGDSASITMRDRWDIRRADAMLIHFPEGIDTGHHVGTTVELGWADAFRVPVILACGLSHIEYWWDHPIVKGCVGWHVTELNMAVNIINNMFKDDLS
jgi:nucleoside 2-deoxyribosyltransferase